MEKRYDFSNKKVKEYTSRAANTYIIAYLVVTYGVLFLALAAIVWAITKLIGGL